MNLPVDDNAKMTCGNVLSGFLKKVTTTLVEIIESLRSSIAPSPLANGLICSGGIDSRDPCACALRRL
jgi:hypothetical protein